MQIKMSKNRLRWSDQHLNQLRVQMEAFKEIIKDKATPKMGILQLAEQRQMIHQKSMDSYKEKFEDYDLDYCRIASKFIIVLCQLNTFLSYAIN